MRTVTLNAAEYSFFDSHPEADGREVVVLLHGFPLDHRMWTHQIEALQNVCRVIAVDLRGHGQSVVPDATSDSIFTMSEIAQDVGQLLDHLRIVEPVTLCGLSMGGYVAFEFWSQFADRLKRLVLCDTRAEADGVVAARAREMMAEKVLQEGSQTAWSAMEEKLVSDATREQQPELIAAIRQMILATAPTTIAATQRGMARRTDFSAQLPHIDVPTLVIGGSKDVITPPDSMRAMADAMPQASFVKIQDAGHLAPWEQPDAVNEPLVAFVQN